MDPSAQHSFCGLPYELSNFQGHFKCEPSVIVGRPSDRQQLANLVKAYPKVKAVGVGHSWWRQNFCSGVNSSAINIVTTELAETLPASQGKPERTISVDEEAMTATVAAGVTQRTLLRFLDNYRTAKSPDGYTLAAFSWFIDQTIAGAVATATHGSSFKHASLSHQLRGLTLMDASGSIRSITPSSDPHLWRAASVSAGRLGIILDVTISIVKNTAVRRSKEDISTEEFVTSLQRLQEDYKAAAGPAVAASSGAANQDGGNATAAAAGGLGSISPLASYAVWQAVKSFDEVQLFWFIPSRMLWRVTFERLTDGLSDEEAAKVMAADGPSNGLPEGAHAQMKVNAVGTGIGIDVAPTYWSDQYRLYLSINVVPGVYPARESYVSISEMENKLYAAWNSYDQYEVAVPLSKAGDCLGAVTKELYGPAQRWRGFRSPALVRFIRAEHSYLSPAVGEAVMYVNIEDHLSYINGNTNEDFQAVLRVFRSPVCGPARLHWGKAGWPQHAQCFDGAAEYPKTWCDFGCAVHQLDPTGKFSAEADRDIWQWSATDSSTGQRVADAGSCCSSSGFDHARCKCASRTDCSKE
ncbi:hypothetical protein OEZ85_000865 [Tetradesmus obliquus]|uniref:FAD-binding PCMH-type domain-containing protein n=2 Tax=Tetradesmus obliquus TaxID=3088 RepID=A0ABY8ULZ4_TETOB|nr:hypothetical protein OEZ85_000865 [Tetradesmus obliquus]